MREDWQDRIVDPKVACGSIIRAESPVKRIKPRSRMSLFETVEEFVRQKLSALAALVNK